MQMSEEQLAEILEIVRQLTVFQLWQFCDVFWEK